MSQENVEVVRAGIMALGRGNFEMLANVADPNVEWETSPYVPEAGVYRGREAVAAFLREQYDIVWGGCPTLDIERVFDRGDSVLVFVRVRGRGSHTGIPLDVRIAHLVSVRNGKIIRIRVFPDRQEALEAVGLRE